MAMMFYNQKISAHVILGSLLKGEVKLLNKIQGWSNNCQGNN
jgi:hypothetical protein